MPLTRNKYLAQVSFKASETLLGIETLPTPANGTYNTGVLQSL